MVRGSPPGGPVRAVGPVAVGSVVWRFKGQLNLTVIVKATFAFADDADMARVAPEPVLADDVDQSKVPGRSARYSGNLAPYLGSADVMFTGFACATEGPVNALQVRFGLYGGGATLLDKALLVRSDKPFDRMPLVYERAFGGLPAYPENPFGLGGVPGIGEPNILHPHDPQRVGGFGPISRRWPLRKRLLGQTPRSAIEAPVIELPDDFDWAYFQAAPADQQLAFLQGDEWILLEGLHPTLPRARMRLPDARGLARVYGLSPAGVMEGQGLVLVFDTLHVDGADLRCFAVWRRSFPLPDEAALARVRVDAAVETRGAPVVWPAAPDSGDAYRPGGGPRSGRRPHALASTHVLAGTAEPDDEIALATLDILPDEPEPQKMPDESIYETMEMVAEDLVQRAPLPFQTGPSRLEHPSHYPRPRPVRRPAGSQTLTIHDGEQDQQVLPFQGATPSTPPPPMPPLAPLAGAPRPVREPLPAPAHSTAEPAHEVPAGFRDAAPAPRPSAPPAPAREPTSWTWREEPHARDAPAPAPAAPPAPKMPSKVDVRSVLYGGRKRRG